MNIGPSLPMKEGVPQPTPQQAKTLWHLFQRSYDTSYEGPAAIQQHYYDFLGTVFNGLPGEPNVLFVRWAHMTIGIETDGHAHS